MMNLITSKEMEDGNPSAKDIDRNLEYATEKKYAKDTYEEAREYVEVKLRLTYLNFSAKLSEIVSSLTVVFVIAILALVVLYFLSVGLALLIGQCFKQYVCRLFIMALFFCFLLIGVAVFFTRLIKEPLMDFIIRKLNSSEKNAADE